MKLLGGSEKKEEADNRNEEIGDMGDIGEIKRKSKEEKLLEEEEIVEAVKKMKIEKAAGIDGIPLEAWKYGGTEREKGKEKEKDKIYAVFVDLKAAFDNVDREILWSIMEEKGVDGSLIKRIKKIYEETEVVIRTKDGLSQSFITKKGVRQGCVLSPALFSLYIADIDKELEKRNIGGIALGKSRIWTLAYADDMVIVAKNKEALESMMEIFKRFIKERKLELNVEKTKIVVFNSKGRSSKRKVSWK
ncbi:hypothetical protein RF55_14524 [Lasius niger]|uniref:Reverse transcriptase domain-containing protein n=1 Tax=Lasius niger TaxID=67767 RepID=A0A0J7N1F0_LASNI|nr:hypothetical protein RF55_14524 [Lasius niger]